MTTRVTVRNEEHGHGEIAVVRRFPATGNETLLAQLPEGREYTGHVWSDNEIVIREVTAPPATGDGVTGDA